MNKAIFLDLDGTLLTSKNQITQKTIQSVNSVIKKGYTVFLITGKSFANSKEIYEKLNLKTELITYGGQVISLKKADKYFHKKTFLNAKQIYKLLKEPILLTLIKHFLIETETTIYRSNNKNDYIVNLLMSPNQKVLPFERYKGEQALGFYLDINKASEEELLKVTKTLRKKYQDLFFSYWDTEYKFTTISITPKESSKWNVISKLNNKYKFQKIITFGNGYTDVEMIKNADIGYAMQNSFESVKKFANKITELDNNNNGVALELDKLN